MRIAVVHNEYGRRSGEESVVEAQMAMLAAAGHRVLNMRRSSAPLLDSWWKRFKAFFSALYSPSACREIQELLANTKPDLVHIHNLYPLLSPAILPVCTRAGVPVVMTVHNYRLVCPNGLQLSHGEVCERCCGGREYWCFLRNCENNFGKSLGYALRNWWARKRRYYLDNVVRFICLTEFQRQRLIADGYPEGKLVLVPNAIDTSTIKPGKTPGNYIGFVGRLSPEKGVETFIAAARSCPDIPFRVAGATEPMPQVPATAPDNVEFLGQLNKEELRRFYRDARIIAFPTKCFEGFPLVLLEAMAYGKPVICSRIGGLPEIVDNDKTGSLFEPGNAGELAAKIKDLFHDPERCRTLGTAGRDKVKDEYSLKKHTEQVLSVYCKAIGKAEDCD